MGIDDLLVHFPDQTKLSLCLKPVQLNDPKLTSMPCIASRSTQTTAHASPKVKMFCEIEMFKVIWDSVHLSQDGL